MERIEGLDRIGLVATDPLRVEGLQGLMSKLGIRVVLLSAPRALDTDGVGMVLVDSGATEHVLELLEAFRQKRPTLKLILLGPRKDHTHIKTVMRAGAKGYVSYAAREDELTMAIKVVQEGSAWAPRIVMAELLKEAQEEQSVAMGKAARFTPRELDVLELLEQGLPNEQIATRLGVGIAAIKAHVGRMLSKVGAENRTQLSLYRSRLMLTH